MRHMISLGFACLVAFAWIPAIPGGAIAANRYALVIGNDAYEFLTPLQKAANDARAVGDALEGIGFTVVRGENLTLREMQDRLFDLTGRLAQGDTVLLFYAGHGVAVGGGNYLLPVDTPILQGAQAEGRVRFAGLAEADLIQQVKDAGALLTVVILDACRDNPFPKNGTRSVGATRGLARMPDQRGVFGIYSAGFGQTALDRLSNDDPDPNSVFTRVLVPALKENGLSLIDVAYRISEKVEALAKTVDHDQTPAYYDEARGKGIYLAGKPSAPDIADLRPSPPSTAGSDPCRDAAAHWAGAQALGEVSLYEEHLKLFGSCSFANLARSALAKAAKAAENAAADAQSKGEESLVAALQKQAEETKRKRMMQPTECDRLAAIRSRPENADGITGVEFSRIQPVAAIAACEEAVAEQPDVSRFVFQLGRSYEAAKEYDEAREWYHKAVELGSTYAMSNLGMLYSNGNGVPVDKVAAATWFRKSAELGNAYGMVNLGDLYAEGVGVQKDVVQAMKWYRKGAELGSSYGMINIGILYERGNGVPKDPSESAKWYRKAAAIGDARAMHNLGILYGGGKGVVRDEAEAFRWYRQGAQLNDAASMYQMGRSYAERRGVSTDFDAASEWIEKALRAGDDFTRNEFKTNSRGWPLGFRKALQRRLQSAGAYDGVIDGDFGGSTQAAMDAIFDKEG